MTKILELYEQVGRGKPKLLAEFTFTSEPQNGDRIDLDDGTATITRRWTKDGELVLDIQRQGVMRC